MVVAAYACLLARSLTPHTHPPKGTILIYNLLFCISRFVLFFFCFVDFSIIFMCDLEWHFDSGYFISSFECLNTCAYCTWNVSEDVLVYRVMCFAYNTLFSCCFFSRVVALNQMKFIISSWISFTLCAHILRPCFFFLSIRNLFHKTTIHTLRLRLLLSETNSLWFSACGRIYFPFSF